MLYCEGGEAFGTGSVWMPQAMVVCKAGLDKAVSNLV